MSPRKDPQRHTTQNSLPPQDLRSQKNGRVPVTVDPRIVPHLRDTLLRLRGRGRNDADRSRHKTNRRLTSPKRSNLLPGLATHTRGGSLTWKEARTVLAITIVLASTGCMQVGNQSAADEAAATFADRVLLPVLTQAADLATAGERLVAVNHRLKSPDKQFLISHADSSWVVGDVRNSQISVTVYHNWEDKSFAAAQAWGIACREYMVAKKFTVQAVDCPNDTREPPGQGAIGWFYWDSCCVSLREPRVSPYDAEGGGLRHTPPGE